MSLPRHNRSCGRFAAAVAAALASGAVAHAYVGPGAGFALASSFLVFLAAFALAALVFITSPVRLIIRLVRRLRRRGRSRCSRVVIVGLDGMSPVVARRLMDKGRLPNFSKMAREGAFLPLRSTVPSASPVAWSTFQTGVNPGKHGIFDFLASNRRTYMPDLSSAQVRGPGRSLRLGKYRIPLGGASVSLKRKSQPFWKVLGEHGVFSIVLRVPITFPPEKFHGVMLSGMCVPDLRGTQGSFTHFTTDATGDGEPTGGLGIVVTRSGDTVRCEIPGPPDPLDAEGRTLTMPLTVRLNGDGTGAVLDLPGQRVDLPLGRFSPWVRLTFRGRLRSRVQGICRFYLSRLTPEFGLYVTPINIDPASPALPLSHPFVYAPYLAKVFGPFATLGLAEDTWALNEGVIDEAAFLEYAYAIHGERETMFFDALAKVDDGVVACVFDITDRVQHMFWRYTPEGGGGDGADAPEAAGTVERLYERMDDMVGRVLSRLGEDDVLIVMSDHGFGTFARCVSLNAWLLENGFLALEGDADRCEGYFKGVDWKRTRAYALGLGGIFINQAGREAQGTVSAGAEKAEVKQAIIAGLTGIKDPESGANAVSRVFDADDVYSGPYCDAGPDLIAGFADGYRVSWDSVTGKFDSTVFEDNEKAWGGDHCVDPDLVPGVLFCNRGIGRRDPGIVDLAPTVLDLFGVPKPRYMDGESLLPAGEGGD